MAPFDEFEEKTEAPTPRRREEARERGQVARSTDLSAAIGLLGAMLALNIFGPAICRDMVGLCRMMLGYQGADAVLPASMSTLTLVGLYALAKMTLPLCLILMVVAVVVSLAQVGFVFTFHPLTPDLRKVDPVAGFARIFSAESLVKLGIGLFKVALIGAVTYFTIKGRIGQIVATTRLDDFQILGLSAALIFLLGMRLALILLIIGLIDYAYTRYKFERQLRMTRQEVKEELRRMEGDPLVKERRRRVARQLALQRMQHAVPRADVVITNPTELAVALKYDAQTMAAPRVVAKGAGYLAERIRNIALRHRVPLIERKPLARALYKNVDVGQEIPPAFYKAVAEILAYVYELSGKSDSVRSASSATTVPNVGVPR